jgi:glycosyltransferase involved in cell wall biosynthesis
MITANYRSLIPHDFLQAEYSKAAIFCHSIVAASNGDKKVIPDTIVEAMAAGMPILATRIVCHTDVLGDNCVFWAQDDSVSSLVAAIEQAWAKKGDMPFMGQQAALHAQECTWQRSAEKLAAALYKALRS